MFPFDSSARWWDLTFSFHSISNSKFYSLFSLYFIIKRFLSSKVLVWIDVPKHSCLVIKVVICGDSNVHGNKLNRTILLLSRSWRVWRICKNIAVSVFLFTSCYCHFLIASCDTFFGHFRNLSSNNLQGPIPIELSRIGNLDTL